MMAALPLGSRSGPPERRRQPRHLPKGTCHQAALSRHRVSRPSVSAGPRLGFRGLGPWLILVCRLSRRPGEQEERARNDGRTPDY